ncbi:MAG: allophanate hydrolase, partial [Burkholderiales bacterium]|nr:allophanate hydrolase [Burkholderiales bacterium]
VLAVAAGFDPRDPFSRTAQPFGADFGAAFTFGVPRTVDLQFFGNVSAERLFAQSVERLQALGGTAVEIDLAPFLEAARLLYDGPWVAERYAAIGVFFDRHAEDVFPVTRTIIDGSRKWSAADAHRALYRLRELQRATTAVWAHVDVLLTPTAGTLYRVDEVEAEPLRLNANLGYYTNFVNLLDLCATAVPAGFQDNGLPFGITLVAPAHRDVPLLRLASRLQRAAVDSMGATGQPLPAAESIDVAPLHSGTVQVAVCGAHMSGLPLNPQLTSRGARLIETTRTAPRYRFYALPGGPPWRPGLIRAEGGASIEVEVWELPAAEFGSFVAGIPAPLGIGTLELEDGSTVQGFVCEAYAAQGAQDITQLGGWRGYLSGS